MLIYDIENPLLYPGSYRNQKTLAWNTAPAGTSSY